MAKSNKYRSDKEKVQADKYAALLKELPPFCGDFLDGKAKTSISTGLAYAQDLVIFFKYLKEYSPAVKDLSMREIEVDVLNELTYRDINEYQKYLSASDHQLSSEYSNNSRGLARKMSSLRGLYKYLVSHDEIKNDATSGADEIKINSADHEIIRMNASEVNKLLESVINGIGDKRQIAYLQNTRKRDYALLYLFLNTGIRVSECVGLDISDINFNENSMRVIRKRKKENILYFDDELADILKDYIYNERDNYVPDTKEDALFLSTRKTRLSVRSIQQVIEKYAGEAVSNKHITPHKLRSTYGTALYNQTGDIRLVSDVLGHSNISTTSKFYAAVEQRNRKRAATIKPYQDD